MKKHNTFIQLFWNEWTKKCLVIKDSSMRQKEIKYTNLTHFSATLWTDEQPSCKYYPLHQGSLCLFVSNRPLLSIKTLATSNRMKFFNQHVVSVWTPHSWATGLRTTGGKEGGGENFKSLVCLLWACFPSGADYTYTRTSRGEGLSRGCLSINIDVTTSRGSSPQICHIHSLLHFIYNLLSNNMKPWK